MNVPYAIPDPNVIRRAVGYAISIKGGLKVRNPDFVSACRSAAEAQLSARRAEDGVVVLIDTKGGDLTVPPKREGSGQLDPTDSQCLRAAFELKQAGFRDVRYVKGGLPGAVAPLQAWEWLYGLGYSALWIGLAYAWCRHAFQGFVVAAATLVSSHLLCLSVLK